MSVYSFLSPALSPHARIRFKCHMQALMALVITTGSIEKMSIFFFYKLPTLWYSIAFVETKLVQRPVLQPREEPLNGWLVFLGQSKNSLHSFIKVVSHFKAVKPEARGQDAFGEIEESPIRATQTLMYFSALCKACERKFHTVAKCTLTGAGCLSSWIISLFQRSNYRREVWAERQNAGFPI